MQNKFCPFYGFCVFPSAFFAFCLCLFLFFLFIFFLILGPLWFHNLGCVYGKKKINVKVMICKNHFCSDLKCNTFFSYWETSCIFLQFFKYIIHYLTLYCVSKSCKVDVVVKLLQNKWSGQQLVQSFYYLSSTQASVHLSLAKSRIATQVMKAPWGLWGLAFCHPPCH